jgi:hypothetical protein
MRCRRKSSEIRYLDGAKQGDEQDEEKAWSPLSLARK